MSPEEVIRIWKDPDDRGTDLEADHPSGSIDLSVVGGNELTTLPCFFASLSIATEAMSCFPSCQETYFDGSCNVFSIGCCPAT